MAHAFGDISWERCRHTKEGRRCTGIALVSEGSCLGHATDDERQAALESLKTGGLLRFVSGVSLGDSLLRTILEALPRDETGRRIAQGADFSHTRFHDKATFDGIVFDNA